MVGTPSPSKAGYREWCSGSLSTSHNFSFDFILQGKVSGGFYPKSAVFCVGMCQRGITLLHLGVIHLAHLCVPMLTAGASVTEEKCASAQNPSSCWILLWSFSWEKLLETASLQSSEISREDFSALPLLFPTFPSHFSEYHLPFKSPAQQQNQPSERAFLFSLHLSVSPLVQETSPLQI